MNSYIVIIGGPVDGFKYYGPFPTYLAAEAFVQSLQDQDDSDVPWWVTKLIPVTV